MEPQNLSEDWEWEARRVAAAFGIEGWEDIRYDIGRVGDFRGRVNDVSVSWSICEHAPLGAEVDWIGVGELTTLDRCMVKRDLDGQNGEQWRFGGNPLTCIASRHAESTVRGLYRLGVEDENVLSQLPELSAHEKLELRLSMPREFWPQKWRDEEAK